jgi:hypothetical protein
MYLVVNVRVPFVLAALIFKSHLYSIGLTLFQIKIIAEVRNQEHGLDLRRLLTSRYQEDLMWNTDHSATYTHSS